MEIEYYCGVISLYASDYVCKWMSVCMEARYFVNVRWFKAAVARRTTCRLSNPGDAAASQSAGNTWGEWTSTERDKIWEWQCVQAKVLEVSLLILVYPILYPSSLLL